MLVCKAFHMHVLCVVICFVLCVFCDAKTTAEHHILLSLTAVLPLGRVPQYQKPLLLSWLARDYADLPLSTPRSYWQVWPCPAFTLVF